MIALAILLTILQVTICVPFCYLAGKMHEFSKYGWGAADMSRLVDTLYDALKRIKEDKNKLIFDPLFMINIFQEHWEQLPPFKEYWDMTFKKKQMQVIAQKMEANLFIMLD